VYDIEVYKRINGQTSLNDLVNETQAVKSILRHKASQPDPENLVAQSLLLPIILDVGNFHKQGNSSAADIVQKYCSKGNLHMFLFDRLLSFRQTPESLVKLQLKMANAVKQCHECNVIHFDIKEENFFVDDPETEEDDDLIEQEEDVLKPDIKLGDWGHAFVAQIPLVLSNPDDVEHTVDKILLKTGFKVKVEADQYSIVPLRAQDPGWGKKSRTDEYC
jgi:serine/threonine protein kinase